MASSSLSSRAFLQDSGRTVQDSSMTVTVLVSSSRGTGSYTQNRTVGQYFRNYRRRAHAYARTRAILSFLLSYYLHLREKVKLSTMLQQDSRGFYCPVTVMHCPGHCPASPLDGRKGGAA